MERIGEAADDEDVMAGGFQSRRQAGAQQRAFADARPPVQDERAVRDNLRGDAFDFGLGICGVGGYTATSKESWYLKVNHKNPELGGELVKLRPGDYVLWALAKYPYPKELALEGPAEATPGLPFAVRVLSYDDRGKRKPVKGALVTGGAGPTDAQGKTTVTVTGPTVVRATHAKDIPSNGVGVCVLTVCP